MATIKIERTTLEKAPPVSFRFSCDPNDLSPEDLQSVWTGVAHIVHGILTPEEQQEFLDKMNALKDKIAAT